MPRIAITGASGFIGRALVGRLLARKFGVIALGRTPGELHFPARVECRTFDPNAGRNPAAFAGADAVVHLAGESVAGYWSAAKKRAIAESRARGTRAVIDSLAACSPRPRVFISASATGYYGSRGDESLDESAAPGSDFLAEVCVDWEREAREGERLGMRCVQMRTGIVLGEGGGALAKMTVPFRAGLGGPFGSGRQFVPWIHIDDLVNLYVLALERDLFGPINAVAPDYATSARFAQALGAAVRRPALIPAPGFALRLFLGEFAQTLLNSQVVVPARAQDAGFSWYHATLETALAALFPRTNAWPTLKHFETQTFLPRTIDEAFSFFSEARNLEAITPKALRFQIKEAPLEMKRGAQIAYELRLHGVPFKWKTLISCWNPPFGFDDVQLHGPYALWHHEHRFEAVEGGVLMKDRVTYALPFYPLSELAVPLVAADVKSIFAYRRGALIGAPADATA